MSFYDGDLEPVSLRDSQDTLYEALMDHRDPTQRVTLVLESGYIVREPLYVEQRSFAHVTILSKDDVVPCEMDDGDRLFWFDYQAVSPRIVALFDMQGRGWHGAFANRGARMLFVATKWHRAGIINAGRRNAYAYRGGYIDCAGKRAEGAIAKFGGAGWDGLYAYRGSWIAGTAVNVDGCQRGISARFGGTVDAAECSARNCREYGAYARPGGFVDVSDGDLRGAGKHDISIKGGTVNASHGARYDSTNIAWYQGWNKRAHGLIA